MNDDKKLPEVPTRKIIFPILLAIFCIFFSYKPALAQSFSQGFPISSQAGDQTEASDRSSSVKAGEGLFHDGFETLDPVVTYTDDVQPILGAKCANCHTGAGIGGHNIGTVYEDAFLPATDPECSGLNIAECSLVLIQNGAMPLGGGCTGDPAMDAGNDACLTQLEQDLIQAWIDMGLLE